MRRIPLTNGGVALVDEEDFELVALYRWTRTASCRTFYARARIGKKRLILAAPVGMPVDHINHDGLDNRRTNIRLANAFQNACNRQPRRVQHSRFKGVSPVTGTAKWQAHIAVNGKVLYLGAFLDEESAALARDNAARRLHGEFAYLNFPDRHVPNVREYRRGSSGYRGITYHARLNKWEVQVCTGGGRQEYCGIYSTAEEAAHVYDAATLQLKGDRARLNFPQEHAV